MLISAFLNHSYRSNSTGSIVFVFSADENDFHVEFFNFSLNSWESKKIPQSFFIGNYTRC